MKPKSAKPVKEGTYDNCQTPPYAVEPLLPYLNKFHTVWECASGEGLLATKMDESLSGTYINRSDIQDGFDFLTDTMDNIYGEFGIVTNPPFSMKYHWLRRCYEYQQPFALLLPVETLGAKQAQTLFKKYGAEFLFLNQRVDFKMPYKAWAGKAQFPVMWICHRILPETVVYGDITESKKLFTQFLKSKGLL